jgi:hypothetical protein
LQAGSLVPEETSSHCFWLILEPGSATAAAKSALAQQVASSAHVCWLLLLLLPALLLEPPLPLELLSLLPQAKRLKATAKMQAKRMVLIKPAALSSVNHAAFGCSLHL